MWNFGLAVQEPPIARFVYANSDKRPGDAESRGDRHVNVSSRTLRRVDRREQGEPIRRAASNGRARD